MQNIPSCWWYYKTTIPRKMDNESAIIVSKHHKFSHSVITYSFIGKSGSRVVVMLIRMTTVLVRFRCRQTKSLTSSGSGNSNQTYLGKVHSLQSKQERSSTAISGLQKESIWPPFNDINDETEILKQPKLHVKKNWKAFVDGGHEETNRIREVLGPTHRCESLL